MSRSSCRRNMARLRLHRSYTTAELAKCLEVHVRTVQNWRKQGLEAIDPHSYPMLFLGAEVRRYLKERRQQCRTKLGPDELYCLKCRAGVRPQPERLCVRETGRTIGKGRKQVIISGRCPHCGSKLGRLATDVSILQTVWGTKDRHPDKRLLDTQRACHNADL